MSEAPFSSARPSRPRVFVTRRLPEAVERRMGELFDVVLRADDAPLDAAALAEAVRDIDVLVPTITDRIDADLIAAAGPRLTLIANFGNGVDHIDLKAARARRIVVTNTPGALTEDTADLAMSLILALPRRIVEGERVARSGTWAGWSPTAMLGHRIGGRTLGILGMGRIGRAVAARAKGFGVEIVYHNRRRLPEAIEAELGATYLPSADALMEAADIVSIHCPLTAQTHGMIDARRLGLLGADGYLVNIARGEIVDGEAVIRALEDKVIAGAGLDVFDHAPVIDPRLIAMENVLLLPHIASATHEARAAQGAKVIANIKTWADGHRPPDQVLEGWV
ncbi:D-glycerate dehydrogenase [Sphingomonas sp. AP4-R1]|uniref:2-hydroxyacid dehydrogenase n=1 Tax=Sphingomonas sp. AP4-R1 TaxID=2735134 RepID=UPI0014938C53|nr:D-glycerate dehydrogenase [Sphingomonas sp. AP4-R1]QJU58090.1 D-glycerate dehydrogenase [Sphingomonas sp. AP4-R1]